MADVKEQQIFITAFFKLGKTAAETHRLVKEAFGDNALGLIQTCEWFKHIKKGRISADDEERSGRTSTGTASENVAEVREAIPECRRRTIGNSYDIAKLSYGTCQQILPHELNMWRIAAKFMSRLPGSDQKQHRVAACSELKEQTGNHPNFASTIITGDGSLIYGFDLETKQQ